MAVKSWRRQLELRTQQLLDLKKPLMLKHRLLITPQDSTTPSERESLTQQKRADDAGK